MNNRLKGLLVNTGETTAKWLTGNARKQRNLFCTHTFTR